MTFRQLHGTIQVVFSWSDDHLHAFRLPDHRRIVMDMDEDDFYRKPEDVNEDKACVDDYVKKYKWIRYIYDFGDDWRHKIVWEKDDPSYDQDHPQLLKYKDDNYYEDSGGIWRYGFGDGEYNDNRFPPDEEEVEEKSETDRDPLTECMKKERAIWLFQTFTCLSEEYICDRYRYIYRQDG